MFSKKQQAPVTTTNQVEAVPEKMVATQLRPAATSSVLGHDLRFTGNLSGEGDIRVVGTLEGDIRVKTVQVAEGARVDGMIVGEKVRIDGHVHGGVTAAEVHLGATGRLNGDVSSDRFSLEPGSSFEGRSQRKRA